MTLTECTNEPITHSVTGESCSVRAADLVPFLLTVLPDYLEPYFTYAGGAINVQGLNSMVASNGTTGRIMVRLKFVHAEMYM